MSLPRYKILLEKSISAIVSAIELYNKPNFEYREESFSILLINAWELLFKAKILKDNNNNIKSLYIPKKTETKKWKKLKRFYPKITRSWNPFTISIYDAMKKLSIDNILKENLEILLEIRDSSVHFVNKEKYLDKKILEIWTANLKSYIKIVNNWFEANLSNYNFYLMPISFFHPYEMESFSINSKTKQLENLINYINWKETLYPSDENKDYNISLKLETKYIRSSNSWSLEVFRWNNPNALHLVIDSEEAFANKYPLSHKELLNKLKERYNDFKQWPKFNQIKGKFKDDKNYCDDRYLNFRERTWAKQKYYSNEILKEFDKNYTKNN